MNYATAIDEILDLAKEKPLEAREQAIKLLYDKAGDYAGALIAFSTTFKQIKEDYYKKSISAVNHEAGEMTGYRHKRLEVEIEAVKELIKLISDLSAPPSPK